MAKVPVSVDREKLVAAIRQAEANGPLENQTALFVRAAELYNRNSPPREISHSVVYLRIREWKIEIKTQPGKKGRQAGVKLSDEQKAKMQAGRALAGPRGSKQMSKIKNLKEVFEEQRKSTPKEFHYLLEKAQAGSKVAALKIKCLDCAAWQRSEVANCGILGCGLYHIRPYKKVKAEVKEEEQESDINDIEVLADLDVENVA